MGSEPDKGLQDTVGDGTDCRYLIWLIAEDSKDTISRVKNYTDSIKSIAKCESVVLSPARLQVDLTTPLGIEKFVTCIIDTLANYGPGLEAAILLHTDEPSIMVNIHFASLIRAVLPYISTILIDHPNPSEVHTRMSWVFDTVTDHNSIPHAISDFLKTRQPMAYIGVNR